MRYLKTYESLSIENLEQEKIDLEKQAKELLNKKRSLNAEINSLLSRIIQIDRTIEKLKKS